MPETKELEKKYGQTRVETVLMHQRLIVRLKSEQNNA
ncbi:hypothetical protein DFR58_116122 [Anaerobacterium chartisolvens]|uniref:Uncharacterized protein n=1 Tax=Anaerobacterium chartisolvens TaxID=1297424 RepID=A0A369B0C4_9FIRM|nr:hypothetical protein DFR58_116122 [Anaerobacterium chartisolvens]